MSDDWVERQRERVRRQRRDQLGHDIMQIGWVVLCMLLGCVAGAVLALAVTPP